MRTSVKARLFMMALALGTSTACYRNARPRGDVEYVVREPPRERVEVVGRSPGSDYVWVKGHWAWRRNDYEWIPGRWAIPERGFREWEPGRWQHERSGWFYIEGRWR
jgi:hypothetical protein